jgi:hypothetical protein
MIEGFYFWITTMIPSHPHLGSKCQPQPKLGQAMNAPRSWSSGPWVLVRASVEEPTLAVGTSQPWRLRWASMSQYSFPLTPWTRVVYPPCKLRTQPQSSLSKSILPQVSLTMSHLFIFWNISIWSLTDSAMVLTVTPWSNDLFSISFQRNSLARIIDINEDMRGDHC